MPQVENVPLHLYIMFNLLCALKKKKTNSTTVWIFQINFLVLSGVIEPMCNLLEVKDTKVCIN